MPTDSGEFDSTADALARLGSEPVPTPREDFVDGLEAELRARHTDDRSGPIRRGLSPRVLLGAAASVLVLMALIGLSQLDGDDRSPLEVSTAATTEAAEMLADRDGSGGDEATAEQNGGESEPGSGAAEDATPTPLPEPSPTPSPQATLTPVVEATPTTVAAVPGAPATTTTPQPSPSSTPNPVVTSTSEREAEVTPIPTPSPIASPTPASPTLATPVPVPTDPPEPTAIPSPTPTAPAVATPVPVPTDPPPPTATPVPTPSAVPSPTPEALEITLSCEVQRSGGGAQVRCDWPEAVQPIDGWALLRIRNGADREVVERMRPDMTEAVDALVRSGDEILYAVQGLLGEQVVLESIRVTVEVP